MLLKYSSSENNYVIKIKKMTESVLMTERNNKCYKSANELNQKYKS